MLMLPRDIFPEGFVLRESIRYINEGYHTIEGYIMMWCKKHDQSLNYSNDLLIVRREEHHTMWAL